ncbi:MAG: putative iron-regulated membrane protein [Oleiphilaceae bacterium]|jgi:uncharacterized iron-regulated membrane protein
MKNNNLYSILLGSVFVTVSTGVLAQARDATELVQGWSGQALGILAGVLIIVQVLGVVLIISAGVTYWLQNKPNPPQRLADAGIKPVLVSAVIGVSALILGTIIRILIGTTVEGEGLEGSEVEALLGHNKSVIESRYEQGAHKPLHAIKLV